MVNAFIVLPCVYRVPPAFCVLSATLHSTPLISHYRLQEGGTILSVSADAALSDNAVFLNSRKVVVVDTDCCGKAISLNLTLMCNSCATPFQYPPMLLSPAAPLELHFPQVSVPLQ